MPNFTVLHIHSGDPQSNATIAGWLQRFGATVKKCRDAFDAVELAATEIEPPDAVLVGADWYPDEDWRLVACLRERWPEVSAGAYGFDLRYVPSQITTLSLLRSSSWLASEPRHVLSAKRPIAPDLPAAELNATPALAMENRHGKNGAGFARRSATIVPWNELAALLCDIDR